MENADSKWHSKQLTIQNLEYQHITYQLETTQPDFRSIDSSCTTSRHWASDDATITRTHSLHVLSKYPDSQVGTSAESARTISEEPAGVIDRSSTPTQIYSGIVLGFDLSFEADDTWRWRIMLESELSGNNYRRSK